MASLWKAPILYVLENNHIAQTTNIDLAVAGSIEARFNAFGIPSTQLNTSDVRRDITGGGRPALTSKAGADTLRADPGYASLRTAL